MRYHEIVESEGDPEGVPHVTKKLLQHIVQQVGTEGAHAVIKSLEWGDGASKELLHLIVDDLKDDIKHGMDEAFNQPYKTKSEKSDYGDVDMLAKLPDGSNLSIMFNQEYGDEGEEVVQVEFYRNNSQEVTGEGDAQRIFATVLDSIQKYIKKYKPQKLSFSASKEVDMDADNVEKFNPESRAKLYDRLVQRYARAWGYRAFRADTGSIVRYELNRIAKGVAEGLDNIPATLYHATYRPLLKSIKKYGLGGDKAQAKWEDSVPGVVYLALDPNVAESYAETSDMVPDEWLDEIVILKISTVGLDKNKFDIDSNVQDNTGDTIQYTGIIPVTNISLVKQGVAENFADGKNPGRQGLAKHLIRESASEREIAQVQYMQGECAVLALTIHKMDPRRFPLGFVYEFFDGVPDMYIEPDEFDELDPARQQDIQYSYQNWTLTHAYVYDVKTQEYIDAEGRHKQLPTIGRKFNATRHNKFPAEVQDLVRVSHYMEWDEAQEEWVVLSGWDALDKAYTPKGKQQAREYAIKYLGIDQPAQDVAENFHDGKHPEDKGDSKRYGVPTHASISTLRKVAKQGGRKGQLAHWMANMKSGRAKK